VHLKGVEEMKTEALKLADELDALHQYVPSEAPQMIRRLVDELDATEKAYKWTEMARNTPTKPLTKEEIDDLVHEHNLLDDYPYDFVRAIEERHGIK
jgi:pheromone shutdown protein TraB